MANAVRDNPERAEFVGYSQQQVRFISFCASGFFAGVAGGLFAINYEILTEENLNLVTSGWVLLMAYIGGVGFFAGTIVGAVLLTLLQTVLSNHTELWQLYVGLLFVLTVMFVPSGLTGLIMMHGPSYRMGRIGLLAKPYALAGVPLAFALAGGAALLEMLHHFNNAPIGDTISHFLGMEIDTHSPIAWGVAIIVTGIGAYGAVKLTPMVREAWESANDASAAAGGAGDA